MKVSNQAVGARVMSAICEKRVRQWKNEGLLAGEGARVGNFGLDDDTAAGIILDAEISAQQGNAFADAKKPKMALFGQGGKVEAFGQANAIVDDGEHDGA